MTHAPSLEVPADPDVSDAALQAPVGFMRLVLSQSYQHANLMTTATGASPETRRRWATRATQIKELLDQLPAPENPRDPFDDIPGEPTPEEAEAVWRERAEADDRREAARQRGGTKAQETDVPAADDISIEDLLSI